MSVRNRIVGALAAAAAATMLLSACSGEVSIGPSPSLTEQSFWEMPGAVSVPPPTGLANGVVGLPMIAAGSSVKAKEQLAFHVTGASSLAGKPTAMVFAKPKAGALPTNVVVPASGEFDVGFTPEGDVAEYTIWVAVMDEPAGTASFGPQSVFVGRTAEFSFSVSQ